MLSLGFVGLGSMGGPMCRRLTRAGYAVHAFDLDPAKLAEAVGAGAIATDSAVAAAASADILLTSLFGPDQVQAVMVDGRRSTRCARAPPGSTSPPTASNWCPSSRPAHRRVCASWIRRSPVPWTAHGPDG